MVEEYLIASQDPQNESNLHIRTNLRDIAPLITAVRWQVHELDADQPIGQITTMDQAIAASLATRRLTMVLLAAFASLALVLASVGLYGVMALTVTQRTRELGIRMALGAQRRSVFGMIIGQGALLAMLGIVMGLLLAIMVTRMIASFLFGVQALDPLTFAIGAMLVIGVAILACYLPARRATRIDPLIALRYE